MSETPAARDNRADQTHRNNQTSQTDQPILQGLTLHPILADENDLDPRVVAHGDFPRHKYEKIIVSGFTSRLSTDEIVTHPLVRLLHDYKHLVLHGDRGNGSARAKKRKSKEPFENHYCRLSFVYTLAQNPETFDLIIKFVVDTAFQPIWTNYDGSRDRDMTLTDIARVTANFIESYLAEAESLIRSEATSCSIDSTTIVEVVEVTEETEPAKDAPPASGQT